MTKLTELVFILDRSGSMYELSGDAVGGFNSLIEKQKQEEGKAIVTTVLFNSYPKFLYKRIPIEFVKPIQKHQYHAEGSTALLDAVGNTISLISDYQNSETTKPDKTIVVITTDGMENSSYDYTISEVKKMIEKKKENGWEFIFLGANIDVIDVAESIGIAQDRAAEYSFDMDGLDLSCRLTNNFISRLRKNDEHIGSDWKSELEDRMKNIKESERRNHE